MLYLLYNNTKIVYEFKQRHTNNTILACFCGTHLANHTLMNDETQLRKTNLFTMTRVFNY